MNLVLCLVLFALCIEGKGFGGGRGGGLRGSGIFRGSKSSRRFGGSSSYNRVNNYGRYDRNSKLSAVV